jgi:hypothetical protein
MQSSTHPTWARIAKDYLPIQGSAVPCERRFSSSGLTSTDRRNRLIPHTFECLQLLKDGYRSGAISATEEVNAWNSEERYEWDAAAEYDDGDVEIEDTALNSTL